VAVDGGGGGGAEVRRAGYVVRQEGGGVETEGRLGCVRVRKVKDGVLVRRVGRVVDGERRKGRSREAADVRRTDSRA